MLSAIENGRVVGCAWRQADILHLETTVDLVTGDGTPFVFYDRNATLKISVPYTDLVRLDAVAWDLITEPPQLDGFCKYFNNMSNPPRYSARKEHRQAEFLVHGRVNLEKFLKIGVIDEGRANEVRTILAANGVNLAVEVKRDWYFLGQ